MKSTIFGLVLTVGGCKSRASRSRRHVGRLFCGKLEQNINVSPGAFTQVIFKSDMHVIY